MILADGYEYLLQMMNKDSSGGTLSPLRYNILLEAINNSLFNQKVGEARKLADDQKTPFDEAIFLFKSLREFRLQTNLNLGIGDVWALAEYQVYENIGSISSFIPKGITGGGINGSSIAVNPLNGDIWIVSDGNINLKLYRNGSLNTYQQFSSTYLNGISVNPNTGDVWLAAGTVSPGIYKNVGGISSFVIYGSTSSNAWGGVAVNSTTGDVWAISNGSIYKNALGNGMFVVQSTPGIYFTTSGNNNVGIAVNSTTGDVWAIGNAGQNVYVSKGGTAPFALNNIQSCPDINGWMGISVNSTTGDVWLSTIHDIYKSVGGISTAIAQLTGINLCLSLSIASNIPASLPSNFSYWVKMISNYNGQLREVSLLSDEELANRRVNLLTPKLTQYPACQIVNNQILLYPNDINNAEFTYLAHPIKPVFDYYLDVNQNVMPLAAGQSYTLQTGETGSAGQTSGTIISNTVELQWNQDYHMEFFDAILLKLSSILKDQMTAQISKDAESKEI